MMHVIITMRYYDPSIASHTNNPFDLAANMQYAICMDMIDSEICQIKKINTSSKNETIDALYCVNKQILGNLQKIRIWELSLETSGKNKNNGKRKRTINNIKSASNIIEQR